MSDGTETGKPMSETTTEGAENAPEAVEQQKEQVFTPAEVEKIVRDRLSQQAKNKFGDYEELQKKAEGAKTLEERLGTLESELSSTKAEALRARIAAKFGISAEKGPNGEPSDADLFLTGSDEDTLTTQAQRLAARQADLKKSGNVAPKEGDPKNHGKTDAGLREFTAQLFGNAD